MEEFKRTNHGWLLCVPVWLDMTDEESPGVEAKGGFVGDIALTVMESFYSLFVLLYSWMNPFWEPVWPIIVGAEVE